MTAAPQRHVVDGIPVLVTAPTGPDRQQLALWQPWLSGAKEAVQPFDDRLADAGFHAVTFDPWGHGERAEEGVDLAASTFADFRTRMWTFLGRSVLDGLRVVDWALQTFHLRPEVVAGGISMGGDLAVALAGLDHRIARVATVGSTPDWARPGMTVLDDPATGLDQGTPDTVASWLYATTDPMTHPERYATGPAIAFEFGADDHHIPAANAEAFAAAVAKVAGRDRDPDLIRVTRHPGLDHLTSGRDEAVLQRCLDWLSR